MGGGGFLKLTLYIYIDIEKLWLFNFMLIQTEQIGLCKHPHLKIKAVIQTSMIWITKVIVISVGTFI